MKRYRARVAPALLSAVALLALVTAAPAQITTTWTGTTSANWTDATNWSPGVPGSADTALFNSSGNGNNSITLAGTTQTLGAIQFDTGANPYVLGIAPGDAFVITANNIAAGVGAISVTSGVTAPQAINGSIGFAGTAPLITNAASTPGATLTLGASPGSSTLTTAAGTTGLTMTVSGSTTVLNAAISSSVGGTQTGATASGGLLFNVPTGGTAATIVIDGQNTYSGITNLGNTGPANVTLQIGSSSVLSGSTIVSGPFGSSTLTPNSGTQTPMQAVGGNQVVANPVVLNTGFTVSNAATPFNLTFSGPIAFTSSASRTVTVNTYGQTFTLGASPNSSTLTLAPTGNINLALNASNSGGSSPALLIVNDTIQDNATPPATPDTISFNSNGNNTPMGIVRIAGANTYAGSTTFNNQTSGTLQALAVEIAVSSVGNPGAVTSGPFGKGTVIPNASNTPPIFEPYGADQTFANAMTLTSGFFVATSPSTGLGADPTGPHNLFITGPIADSGKVITNNLVGGVALYLGTPTVSSTVTMSGTTKIQTQQSGAGAGTTIINDLLTGTGALTVQNGAIVQLNNANTYSGTNTITGGKLIVNNTSGSGTGSGAVNVIGAGSGPAAVGTGGTLGGTGAISGTTTVSANAGGTQGGILYPGPGGATAGTLNVGSMQWNPYGQYVFVHSATVPTVGGGINNLINGSGTLDLSTLSSGGQFDINLAPTNFSPTPTQMTYTIANFVGGIPGFTNGTDISSLFTVSGAFGSTGMPFAMVVAGTGAPSAQAIQISFTPVPEPIFVLAACGGFTALAAWRRTRRSASTN